MAFLYNVCYDLVQRCRQRPVEEDQGPVFHEEAPQQAATAPAPQAAAQAGVQLAAVAVEQTTLRAEDVALAVLPAGPVQNESKAASGEAAVDMQPVVVPRYTVTELTPWCCISRDSFFNTREGRNVVNAGFELGATAAMIALNRLAHNTTLGSKVSADGKPLAINAIGYAVSSNWLKTVYKHMNSHGEQVAVLAATPAVTAVMENAVTLIAGDGDYGIGPALVVNMAISGGFAMKVASKMLLNEPTFYGEECHPLSPKELRDRKIIAWAALWANTAGAAVYNLEYPDINAVSIAFHIGYSTMFNKVIKELLAVEQSRCLRASIPLLSLGMVMTATGLVGLCYRFQERHQGEEDGQYAFRWLLHYGGPVGAVALSGVATKHQIDGCKKYKPRFVVDPGSGKKVLRQLKPASNTTMATQGAVCLGLLVGFEYLHQVNNRQYRGQADRLLALNCTSGLPGNFTALQGNSTVDVQFAAAQIQHQADLIGMILKTLQLGWIFDRGRAAIKDRGVLRVLTLCGGLSGASAAMDKIAQSYGYCGSGQDPRTLTVTVMMLTSTASFLVKRMRDGIQPKRHLKVE